jgi:hypothetical protein
MPAAPLARSHRCNLSLLAPLTREEVCQAADHIGAQVRSKRVVLQFMPPTSTKSWRKGTVPQTVLVFAIVHARAEVVAAEHCAGGVVFRG